MTTTTIKPFRHANTGITYLVGDEFEGTDEQARELCAKGYLMISADSVLEGDPDGELVELEEEQSSPEEEEVALEDMTVAQLRAICDEYGIEVPARAKKENLVAAVKLYEAEAGDEPEEAGDE